MSMYVGPFFRDGRYHLLIDQPPHHVDLLRSPKGERMSPGEPTGILPAGTEVRISEVEFATASATTRRSLLTPRFFTWVFVKFDGKERPGIIVVREEPENHEDFLEILSRYLTTEDVAAKIAGYPEETRRAIAEKRLVSGMDGEAVRMAWGSPLQVTRDYEDGVRIDEWSFEGERRLTIRGGELIDWFCPDSAD